MSIVSRFIGSAGSGGGESVETVSVPAPATHSSAAFGVIRAKLTFFVMQQAAPTAP
jgi:hypothetical protein